MPCFVTNSNNNKKVVNKLHGYYVVIVLSLAQIKSQSSTTYTMHAAVPFFPKWIWFHDAAVAIGPEKNETVIKTRCKWTKDHYARLLRERVDDFDDHKGNDDAIHSHAMRIEFLVIS